LTVRRWRSGAGNGVAWSPGDCSVQVRALELWDEDEIVICCHVQCVYVRVGWWSWADAVVAQDSGEHVPFKYAWPGIIATVALVLINMLPKDDLQDIADSGDDETNMRARLWLLCSFLLAFGAIAGSISVLVSCTEAGTFVEIGVGSVLQCGFILASALILWLFRTRQ
jgi:hypothetical protein